MAGRRPALRNASSPSTPTTPPKKPLCPSACLRSTLQKPPRLHPEEQTTLDLPERQQATAAAPGPKGKKLPWPPTLPAPTGDGPAALKDLLAASPTPLTPTQIATRFARSGKRVDLIRELCQTLTSLGLATESDDQAFAA